MSRALILIILFLFAAGLAAAAAPETKYPYDIQLKSLYAEPDNASKLVYSFPITVKLLDISEDANWYQVQISFRLGPLAYNYIGWTQIPVGDILAEREKEIADLP
jgi:hypothetical protein